ncbi:MAG: hypothetical protein HY881_22305 [Deltaproteobacteria bacterium]|nr:hypothetical protein [Deltaproteobacteria bacterium]
MNHAICVITTIVLFWVSPCALALQDQDMAVIDTFITRQAHRERGEEYKDARKVAIGDLNHDGISDAAVLYTIEGQGGTNNHIQYLAVFVRSNGALVAVGHAKVGGKSYRSVELTSVDDDMIHLKTLRYLRNDAACCPSKKGETHYVLRGRILQEQKDPHVKGRHNP